jgi:hypothetical protein
MDDGPYVVAAATQLRGIVGARILAIDGHPLAAIADTLRQFIPHESEIGFRRQAEHALVFPEVLQGLDFMRDTSGATLDVAQPGGAQSAL